MKAMVFESFNAMPVITQLPDPTPDPEGVVVEVKATGICRSDWHGWAGHDPGISLPHVPGHEFAGVVVAVGSKVKRFAIGDRMIVPFVNGCGRCYECSTGNHQVCAIQSQPGFTHWGSFAQYVAIDYADVNGVHLPEILDYDAAAALGCRFITAFRAVVDQGRLRPGQWMAVHGCGGVGLSAIQIGHALGAAIVAVDLTDEKLEQARQLGANILIKAEAQTDVVAAIREATAGGAHLSLDALGHTITCLNSINCLRLRGRHIQVGLLTGEHQAPPVPMDRVLAAELEIIGSHGMPSHRFSDIFQLLQYSDLSPSAMISRRVTLEQAVPILTQMDRSTETGIAVITTL